MGTFIPNTKDEQLRMLSDIGYKDWDDLFKDIPADARIKGELNIPAGKSELETARLMEQMAGKNVVYDTIFRGAGAYNQKAVYTFRFLQYSYTRMSVVAFLYYLYEYRSLSPYRCTAEFP